VHKKLRKFITDKSRFIARLTFNCYYRRTTPTDIRYVGGDQMESRIYSKILTKFPMR